MKYLVTIPSGYLNRVNQMLYNADMSKTHTTLGIGGQHKIEIHRVDLDEVERVFKKMCLPFKYSQK